MRSFSRTFADDHRRYAAVETPKICSGDISSVVRVLGISQRTI